MAKSSTLLLLWNALFSSVYGAGNGISIAAHRGVAYQPAVDAVSSIRKTQTGSFATELGKSLYWFGNVSVGDSGPLNLLIDTGSSDILIDPGLYKPSKYMEPYVGSNYSITYEGVNRAGFGMETINGTALKDNVTIDGFTVEHQVFANITSYSYADLVHDPTVAIRGQGIIGFLGQNNSAFDPQAQSWFYNLCDKKAVAECRFGLAFGTEGTGQLVLGDLDSDLIAGDLVPVQRLLTDGIQYVVLADATLDNKIIAKDQVLVMDVGTNNIQGPIGVTKQIFRKLGYQSSLRVTKTKGKPTNKVLTGFFPCDKPPTIGFSFPAQSQLKKNQTATNFNIANTTKIWDVYDHGNNNCTSVLGGTNFLTNKTAGTTAWLVGQPFFAGHYIDFDVEKSVISYGDLKNPTTGSA